MTFTKKELRIINEYLESMRLEKGRGTEIWIVSFLHYYKQEMKK